MSVTELIAALFGVCRHPEMIRQRIGTRYFVACSQCGYAEELIHTEHGTRTPETRPTPMSRTTMNGIDLGHAQTRKGYQKKVLSAGAHPDFQRDHFNGPVKVKHDPPKAKADTTNVSAWIGLPRGDQWNEYVSAVTAKTAQQTAEQDNRSARDI